MQQDCHLVETQFQEYDNYRQAVREKLAKAAKFCQK